MANEPDEAENTAPREREAASHEEPRRPAFARDFPRDAKLDAIVRAFADGDFARVRDEAPALAKSSDDEDVKRAATLLYERTKPDPLATWMLALTALLLIVLTGWWISHGHAPKNAPPEPPRMIERVKS